jgi:serine/threonine protein phosphatase PrpC
MSRHIGHELRQGVVHVRKIGEPFVHAREYPTAVDDPAAIVVDDPAAIEVGSAPTDRAPGRRDGVGQSIDRSDTSRIVRLAEPPLPAPAKACPSDSEWPDKATAHRVPVSEPVDFLSTAPVIGKVLEAVAPRLGPGVVHRTPSFLADGVELGPFHVSAASQIGLAHSAQGSVRQDAYDFTLTLTGRLVIAVADGMGSRPNSQVGATHFCEGVVLAAAAKPDASAADYLRSASHRAGEIADSGYGLERDAVSFVGAVAVVDGDRCQVARIGDVSAFTIDTDGKFDELFASDDGYVNVVTASLPTSGLIEPEVGEVRGVPRMALVTDGLANDLRTSTAVRFWLGGIWNGLPTASAMTNALRYRRRGSHDDRTAVVVAIPEPHPTEAS